MADVNAVAANAPRTPRRLHAHQLRALAVAADADPRTIVKMLRGHAVRPAVAERILRAAHGLGFGDRFGGAGGENATG